ATRLYALKLVVRTLVLDITGIQRSGRLEQEKPALFVGDRLVLDSARDDDEFSFFDPLVVIAKLHAEAALHHHDKLVFIVMMMQDELAFKLVELEHLTIEFGAYVENGRA